MSSPGGRAVARVSIRVTPDTTGFKAKVEKDLKSLPDGVVKIVARFDGTKAQAEIDKLKATKITITVDLDTAALRAQLAALPNARAKVDVDTAAATAALATITAAVNKLDGKTITATFNFKAGTAVADLAAIDAAIKRLNGQTVKINLDVTGLTAASAQLATLLTAANRLNGQTIRIHVNITGLTAATAQLAALRAALGAQGGISSAFNALQSAASSAFSGVASSLSSLIPGLGGAGGAARGLTAALGSAGGAALGVVSGLGAVVAIGVKAGIALAKFGVVSAEIVGIGAAIGAAYGAAATAIAAVPAAIGLIAAPAAAVIVGLDGIKAAAKKIEPQFKSLKKAVSAAFEKGLTPVLKQLADVLFPKLAVGLSATADALSTVAKNTVDWLTTQPGIDLMSTALGNINDAIARIDLTKLLGGFIKLAGNKAALDLLVTAVNGVGTALDSISKNTSLDAAFSGLSGVVSSLETAFTDLVNNGITLFARAAPGIKTAIDSITGFFKGIDFGAVGDVVGQVFQDIGDAIKNIDPGTVANINAGIRGLFNTLKDPAVRAGIDGIAQIAAGLIPIFTKVVTEGVRIFSRLPAAILTAVGPLGRILLDKLGIIPAQLQVEILNSTNAIEQGVTSLGVVVRGEASKIPEVMASELGKVPGVARSAAGKTVGLFGTGLGQLSPTLQAKLGILPGQADTELQPLAGTTTQATQAMVDAANAAIPGLGTAFQTGFTAIQGLAATAFTQLNAQFVTFGTAITALAATFTAFGTTVTEFGTQLTAVTNGFTLLGTGLTLLNGSLVTFGTSFTTINASLVAFNASLLLTNQGFTLFAVGLGVVNPLLLAFGTGFTTVNAALLLFNQNLTLVNTAFTTLGTTLTTANTNLVNFGTALTNAGTAATNFGNAVTQAFVQVNTAITTGMQQSVQAVQQGFTDMTAAATQGGTDIVKAATDMMTNFAKAVTDGGKAAVTAIKGVTTDMKAAVDVNILVDTGRQIDEGLAKGITANSGIVQDAVRKVVADAKKAADDAAKVNSPSKLFRDGTGKSISEGLGAGILLGAHFVTDAAAETVMDAFEAAQRKVDTVGSLSFNSAFADFNGKVAAQVSTAVNAALPQAVFHNYTTVDGKIIQTEVIEVVGQWEKDLISAVRHNGGFGGNG